MIFQRDNIMFPQWQAFPGYNNSPAVKWSSKICYLAFLDSMKLSRKRIKPGLSPKTFEPQCKLSLDNLSVNYREAPGRMENFRFIYIT